MDDKTKSLSYDEIVRIFDRLDAGESVLCKKCKKPIILRRPGSGYHPGLFCPNGCTEVYVETGKKET